MSIDSAALYKELEKTYEKFNKTYEGVLLEYYTKQTDLMKRLYVDNPRRVRGIVFVDGTYEISSDLLMELFTNYSTVFVVCACLSSTERKQICENDMTKVTKFEDLSVMRYMSDFFEWLLRILPLNKKRTQDEKIIVYDSTSYTSLTRLLVMRQDAFRRVYAMNYLKNCMENL